MQLSTRGRTFTGVVVASRMQSTATVEWTRRKYVRKYERYLTQKTRVKAHNPSKIGAKEGDIVKIMECRPVSKTKHFIIVERVGHERLFEARQDLLEEGKKKPKKKKAKEKSEEISQSEVDEDKQ